MRGVDLDRTEWLRGTTLSERVQNEGEGREPTTFDLERAHRRLQGWRGQPGFRVDGLFSRRLALDRLDEESVLPLLGEGSEALADRLADDPPWLRTIADLYARAASASEDPMDWPVRSEREPAGFLDLLDPLARDGLARLRRGVEALAGRDGAPRPLPFGLGDPDRVVALFVPTLADRLRGLVTRTLVLELQIARMEERLDGDTPEARFRSFVAELRRPEIAIEILGRYPVLARHALARIDRWVEASLELVERLAEDHQAIRQRLAGSGDPGALVEARGSLSDPHRGGRSVHVLRFASGLRIVYKPKSLAVDAAFQELVRWLGERGLDPALRSIGVIDRGTHGWVEFVEAKPCANDGELALFYRRHGVLLALFFLLEGTDVHFENLIAAGENPVPIDLETLFHARINVPDLARPDDHPGGSFYDSVLRIGLLPEKMWGDETNPGVDLSGLGTTEGQTTQPFRVPVGENTDEMRYELRAQEVAPMENRPTLRGEPVAAEDHTAEVEAGFRSAYRLLLARRDELLSADGPLARFADAEVRVVVRPTRAYGMMLMETFHPQVLGDALERDILLDRIWAGVGERPWLERVVPYERRDLARGDIPLFTARPGSRDLWAAEGERVPELFAESGMERARRRVAAMSEEDLERQAWLIRATLAVPALDKGKTSRTTFEMAERDEPVAADDLLAWARAAGDDVCNLAFHEGERARWLTVQPLAPGNWSLLEVPSDGYMGLSGIVLFLAHLGAATGEERYRRVAEAGVATLRWMIRDYPESVRGIGAFNGWGSLVYCFALLGALWGDDDLLDEAESLLPRIADGVAADASYDLMAGAAGGMLSALALDRLRPSEAARAVARRCGDHLLASAERPSSNQARGIAWRVDGMGPRPLVGLSHGAGGIALALLALADETGDARYREAALAALDFERSQYSEERRNWPDLREGAAELADLHGDEDEHFMCAWCQGAPGIGLGRIAGLPFLDDAEVRSEIAVAVETTLAEGFGTNHSLCHGALGNLDFLFQAARATGDDALARRCRRLAAGVVRSLERDGWLFGLARGAAPVGLMVGLAGVGYGLLRLALPDRVPDVLTVQPPSSRSTSPEAPCLRVSPGAADRRPAQNSSTEGERP